MGIKKTVTSRFHFDAAHRLEGYNGACSKLHGHRWEVEVVLDQPEFDSQAEKKLVFNSLGLNYYEGISFDFKDIKRVLAKETDKLDHEFLNEYLSLSNPTAENLADIIWTTFETTCIGQWLRKVSIYETPTNFATVEKV